MYNFATLIHKEYHQGCVDILNNAIKLTMPFEDMLLILYYYNLSFKHPFLKKEEFLAYTKTITFDAIMEELCIARDWVRNNICSEILDFEKQLATWHKDSQEAKMFYQQQKAPKATQSEKQQTPIRNTINQNI